MNNVNVANSGDANQDNQNRLVWEIMYQIYQSESIFILVCFQPSCYVESIVFLFRFLSRQGHSHISTSSFTKQDDSTANGLGYCGG